MTKIRKYPRSFACTALLLLAVLLILLAVPPAYAANGGLVGANIKDGQLIGYYGEGGDIVIPNTVTMIGPEAFKDNDNVTSVTIPGSVQVIGYNAFEGCTELERIIFSDPVDGADLIIRVSAFINCPKLKECQIPACAVYVTGNVFKGCTSLEKITVHPENPYYLTDDLGVMFGPNVIEGEPQYDDPNLTLIAYPCGRATGGYAIPETVNGRTVDRVWASAFRTAKNLTDIQIPSTCKILGANAFEETSLKDVTIPDTVTELGAALFENCTDLTDVKLPEGMTEIGMSFFDGCTSLQRIDFPSTITSFSIYSFRNCTSLSSLILPDGLKVLNLGMFEGCTNLQRVVVPASVISFPSDDYGALNPFNGCADNLIMYVSEGSTAYKWAVNNALDFGIQYVVTDLNDIPSIDAGEYYLIDAGKKIKAEGAFPLNASLKVEELTSGSDYQKFQAAAGDGAMKAYTVSVLPASVQLPDEINVKFGVDTSFTSNTKLYRISGNQAVTVPSTFVSRTITADVDSLGSFAVIDSTVSGGDNEGTVPTSVTLNKTSVSLEAGKMTQLSATVLPSSAVDKSVTWTSSNTAVATVDSKGVVTAVKAGTASVTVKTSNGLTASCTITVTGGTTDPDPSDSEISTAASLRSAASRTEDDKAAFSLSLKDAKRIATVQITFTADSPDAFVIGKNGFTLIGDVTGSLQDGKYTGTAMLAYLTEDQTTFSCTDETQIAEISVPSEKPSVQVTGMTVSGWNDALDVKFGTVTGIDPSFAEFNASKNYDVNGDGKVDQLDITTAQLYYRAEPGDANWQEASRCDFNEDNVIDVADFIEILLHFE